MENPQRKSKFRDVVIVTAITLLLLEAALRLGTDFLPSPYEHPPRPTDESLFWRYSADTGWDLVPNSSGHFTNGYFDGEVSIDSHGIRKNSREGTYVAGYRNIFFIGDSTTASFEVNDDETAPAVLEKLLREHGDKVNVLNLGIRGYGTDQSVLRAMRYAADFHPTDVIYMYTDNDIFDNNKLKVLNKKFGKGVYIRDAKTLQFKAFQYPVPERPVGYGGLVVMTPSCEPMLYEEQAPPSGNTAGAEKQSTAESSGESVYSRLKLMVREYSYVARALYFLKHRIRDRIKELGYSNADPYELFFVKHRKWHDMSYEEEYALIEKSYEDDGALRSRCRDYFGAQMEFLLNMLKKSTGSPRVHVVQFPVPATIKMLKSRAGAPNSQLFDRLVQQGEIDSHTNLAKIVNDTDPPLKSFPCKGDGHFCEKGNQWIAAEVYKTLTHLAGDHEL